MLSALNTDELTPALLEQIALKAKKYIAGLHCELFHVSLNEGNYDVARAIVNSNISWLLFNDIISPKFKREGLSLRFHKNGLIHTSCNYYRDNRHGLFQVWDDTGNLTRTTLYAYGKEI